MILFEIDSKLFFCLNMIQSPPVSIPQSLWQIQIWCPAPKLPLYNSWKNPPMSGDLWPGVVDDVFIDVICHMWILKLRKLNNDPKNTINSGLGTQERKIHTQKQSVLMIPTANRSWYFFVWYFCMVRYHPLPTIPLLRRAMRHFGRLLRRFGPCQSLKGKCSWSAKRTAVFLAKKGLWRCWICPETSC